MPHLETAVPAQPVEPYGSDELADPAEPAPRYGLSDFAFDLRRRVSTDPLWVGSGRAVVAAEAETICGVAGCFAPPFAAPGLQLHVRFVVDGRVVGDGARPGVDGHGVLFAGGRWQPDRIVRLGTYHHRRRTAGHTAETTVSLGLETHLVPLADGPGFVLRIGVHNRGPRPAEVALQVELEAGTTAEVPLRSWGWMPPGRGDAVPDGAVPAPARLVDVDEAPHVVASGCTEWFDVVVRLGGEPVAGDDVPAEVLSERAAAAWQRRIDDALADLPMLRSDLPGLEAYWRRSLASGLACLWDHPDFVSRPFPATSGMDGGAVCAYAWDTGGYAPLLISLMLGPAAGEVLEAMIAADPAQHYAIAPDGTGLGVPYAYSGWALVTWAWTLAALGRLDAETVRRLAAMTTELDRHFGIVGVLRDYGDQHNLLEMRGSGWEHVVASPNAERAAIADMLADLSEATGAGLATVDLRREAAGIRSAVIRELWDPEQGWFRSVHPEGHAELARSIQGFDALRCGAADDTMAATMFAALRDGAFLGRYGVSSVSAEDATHYELADPDWSGGGAYTGEGPVLALTLWERGEAALAWQVMSRLLWMGEHFPYFPQEHYCDRPIAPPRHRRTNIIAGLAGAEAIVNGLAGVRPQPDGSLCWRPQPGPGRVQLDGLMLAGRSISVDVAPSACVLVMDGVRHTTAPGVELRVPPPAA